MALSYTPMTDLDAVNLMLETIGERPVSSLTVVGLSDVSIAQSILLNTSRSVQSKGWNFNCETNYPLSPDVTGSITCPTNTLKVDATDPLQDITMRGLKLYDRYNHSLMFSDVVNVNITFYLDFNDLPQTAKEYITVRAARLFNNKVLGSDTLYSLSEEEEKNAWSNLLNEEAEASAFNMFNDYSVARIIGRYSNPQSNSR